MSNRVVFTEIGLEKLCPRCEELWPLDSEFFHRNRSSHDGFSHYCKACFMEKYRHNNSCYREVEDTSNRNKEIFYLRKSNVSFREIGSIFGISRQRAHQIYNRLEQKELLCIK